MPPLAEGPLAPEAATGILEDAESLAEDKLSVLESFLESLNLPDSLTALGESALAVAAPFLTALGFEDLLPDSSTPDLTNPSSIQQTNLVPVCPAAPAGAVENTTDLQKPLGEGEVEDLDSPPQGPQTPAEAAELESYLGMNCYQIGSLHSGKMSLLRNGQAGNPGKIERSLDLLEIAAKKNGCHL